MRVKHTKIKNLTHEGNSSLFTDGDWVESKDQDPNGEIRLIQLADVGVNKFKDKSNRYLTKSKASELNCTYLKKGDLLISRLPDPLGRTCMFPLEGEKKYVTVVDVSILRINEEAYNSKYIEYILNAPQTRQKVQSKQTGTTRKRISRKNLAEIEIPLPPLPTQQRIVEKIEELFSELDNGVENLKKAQKQLKTYRQAVLKDAFEGKLTKEWRRQQDDLPTPEELLQQIKAERKAHRQRQLEEWEKEVEQWEKDGESGRKPRKPRKLSGLDEDGITSKEGLQDEWFYIPFEQIGYWQGGGTPSKSNTEYWNNGTVAWVSPKDMKRKNIFETEDYITENAIENSSAKWIKKRSILFVVRSGILRRLLPVAVAKTNLTVNQDLQAFTPVAEIVSDYLYWYAFGNENAIRNSCAKDGTTVESIDSSSLKAYPIPFCSFAEQTAIVKEIESRLSVVDQLEQTIKESLQKAEALRQSILKKAFDGKLVEV